MDLAAKYETQDECRTHIAAANAELTHYAAGHINLETRQEYWMIFKYVAPKLGQAENLAKARAARKAKHEKAAGRDSDR